MGLFGTKRSWERDWGTGEIVPQRQQDPEAVALGELVERVRYASDNAGFEKAAMGLLNLFTVTSQRYARVLPGFDVQALSQAQEVIMQRDDFHLDMLVYSLGYFGTDGTAIARKMMQDDVPAWEPVLMQIATDATTKPATAPIPESLKVALVENGMEPLGESSYRATFNTSGGRTQVLLFSEWDSDTFALLSPIVDSPDGTIPETLRQHNLGDLQLQVVSSIVMLVDLVPAGPPSPTFQAIADRGMPLIEIADALESRLSAEDKY